MMWPFKDPLLARLQEQSQVLSAATERREEATRNFLIALDAFSGAGVKTIAKIPSPRDDGKTPAGSFKYRIAGD